MRDLYAEIQAELDALNERCTNLQIFLGSELFKQLDPQQAGLLQKQYHHMSEYRYILHHRITLMRASST